MALQVLSIMTHVVRKCCSGQSQVDAHTRVFSEEPFAPKVVARALFQDLEHHLLFSCVVDPCMTYKAVYNHSVQEAFLRMQPCRV